MWLELAFVVFFVGGPGGTGFQSPVGGDGNGVTPPGGVPDVGPRLWAVIAVAVGAAALLVLAFSLVGAVVESVLVESLRTETVTVRRYWSRRWRQGLRLFGFRLLVSVFVLARVLLLASPFLLPVLGVGAVDTGVSLALLAVLLPLFVVLAVVVSPLALVLLVPFGVLFAPGIGLLAVAGRSVSGCSSSSGSSTRWRSSSPPTSHGSPYRSPSATTRCSSSSTSPPTSTSSPTGGRRYGRTTPGGRREPCNHPIDTGSDIERKVVRLTPSPPPRSVSPVVVGGSTARGARSCGRPSRSRRVRFGVEVRHDTTCEEDSIRGVTS